MTLTQLEQYMISEIENLHLKMDSMFELVLAQLQELTKAVQRLEVRMDRLEMRMDRLEARVGNLETQVNRLENRVSQLETEVNGNSCDIRNINNMLRV